MKKKRIFIYGSCVSRDTFGAKVPEDMDIVKYVARQSIISSGNKVPVEKLKLHEAKSSFVQRCIDADCEGSVYSDLVESFRSGDFLLMDLVDERLGVYAFDDVGYATRSIDKLNLMGSKWVPEGARYIPFGTDEHFELFKAAFQKFITFIDENYSLSNLTILKHRWANVDIDGRDPVPKPMGFVSADEAWNDYRRYFDFVEKIVPDCVLNVPESVCLSDRHHKWGLAPFHYCDDFYKWVLEAIYARVCGNDLNLSFLKEFCSSRAQPSKKMPELDESKRPLNLKVRQVSSVHEYADVESFLSRGKVPTGIIDIDENGSEISFLFRNCSSDYLVVSFHSDLRLEDRYPYLRGGVDFRGEGISNLRLSDPSCYLSSELSTGWYIGHSSVPNFRSHMIRVIKKAFETSGATTLVFTGSGSGGYAALYYSYFFADSKCLVFNPEFDPMQSNIARVSSYAKLAWGLKDYQSLETFLSMDLKSLYRYGHTNSVFSVVDKNSIWYESQFKPFMELLRPGDFRFCIVDTPDFKKMTTAEAIGELIKAISESSFDSHLASFSSTSWLTP